MKHLKVKAEFLKNDRRVQLTLLEQSHVSEGFGGNSKGPIGQVKETQYFVHEKVMLYSMVSISGSISVFDYRGTPGINRLGIHLGGNPGATTKMSLEYWSMVKPAIEAYNEWGSTQVD